MIRSLRIFFLSRLLREKVLLVGFAVLAVAIWLSSLSTRTGRFRQAVQVASSDLETQALWIAKKDTIEAEAIEASGKLDPARTLDVIRLYSEVDGLLQAAGIDRRNRSSQPPRPDVVSGQFIIHSQDFTVNNLEWAPLKDFYARILDRAPYISVNSFVLQPRPGGTQHTLTLRVSAIENTPSSTPAPERR